MFKKCTSCNHEWQSREEFLSDQNTKMIGYQVNFKELELGWFLFNHITCGTTLAFQALYFSDLYRGLIMNENMHGTASCPDHCLTTGDLEVCPTKCECNYVREVIQIVNSWPKKVKSDLVDSVL